MKIVTVVGARPQFIKASMVSNALKKFIGIDEIIIHTGQHFDEKMSDIFFRELEIPLPHSNLGIHSMGENQMIAQMMVELDTQINRIKPDAVLVYGDTNSTLAAALVTSKRNIKLIHVEAGVRCYNRAVSEETNRLITDRLSDLLFAPTSRASANLEAELPGFTRDQVVLSGDVMKDAYLKYRKWTNEDICKELGLNDQFILSTIHRRETVVSRRKLTAIVDSLNEIHKKKHVVFPMHPHTSQYIRKFNLKTNFQIIEPVGYIGMLSLLDNSDLIITDSGGLNREAFFAEKYSLVIREETEWPEIIEYSYAALTGYKFEHIVSAFNEIPDQLSAPNNNEFGNGSASKIIAQNIFSYLS